MVALLTSFDSSPDTSNMRKVWQCAHPEHGNKLSSKEFITKNYYPLKPSFLAVTIG